jgi:hypothetical protein
MLFIGQGGVGRKSLMMTVQEDVRDVTIFIREWLGTTPIQQAEKS